MTAIVRRIGLVLALLVTFTSLQTGWTRVLADACADADPCADEDVCPDEHTVTCTEDGEEGPCPPSCVDCHGCPGPARALIAAPARLPAATARALELAASAIDLHPRDQARRVERPPRA